MTLESIHTAKEYDSSDMTDESEDDYVRLHGMSIVGRNEDTTNQDGLIELEERIIDVNDDMEPHR